MHVGALGFLIWMGSAIAYWVIAFANDSTTWWWWFVPFYGQVKIFMESVGLGAANLALCFGTLIGLSMMSAQVSEGLASFTKG